MALKNNKKAAQPSEKKEWPALNPKSISVRNVRAMKNKENNYFFSMTVDGISISNMRYITYTDKSGKEASFISFPSEQGRDGKYYNTVWFKIDDKLQARIEEALDKALDADYAEVATGEDLPF